MKAPLVAMFVLLVTAGNAGAQTPAFQLQADTSQRGRIALDLQGPPGAKLRVSEGDRRIAAPTLDAAGHARIADAARWRCDKRRRLFVAEGEAPDGTPLADNAARITPTCAGRFKLTAKKRVRATRPLKVRVRDTFRLGAAPGRICANGPGKLRVCARVKGKRAELRLPRAAKWRLSARRARTIRVRVRPRPGPAKVLATGDSMIQYVDLALGDRLDRVVSDARVSTGLSKPFLLNWPNHAKAQMRRHKPDATVMYIGANDGFAFGDVQCCGKAWQRAYARRASAMMETYSRGGAARVYWCLLPAPRPANFRRVYPSVNAAIRRAAKDHRSTVTVVNLPKVFTPGFRFRQSITWRGRSVSVRQEDGVHLNVAGAAIAAQVIIAHMRRDGAL